MKRKRIGAELIASMEEAVAIVQGKIKPARVTKFQPSVALDIRMIRLATGLSRAEFAKNTLLTHAPSKTGSKAAASRIALRALISK